MLPFPCTKSTPINVCVYICSIVAHTAISLSVWHGSELCVQYAFFMHVLKISNNQLTIVCAFSYTETCSFRGPQTHTHEPGLSDAYATISLLARLFPCCKSRQNTYSISSTAPTTVGSATIVTDTQASLFRDACMLILIWKHSTRAYLTWWLNQFYFDKRCLQTFVAN